MRKCHVCQADNDDDAPRCAACNARLRKRERPGNDLPDSPFAPTADPVNRPAAAAYYLAAWGLVPLLGLVLGPLAVLVGAFALLRGRKHPGFVGQGAAWAAIVLGAAEAVTQWVGVWLMWVGWG